MFLRFFLIAITFFLAFCSVPERDNPLDPDGVNYIGAVSKSSSSVRSSSSVVIMPSSSSVVPSSSSVQIGIIEGTPVDYKNETYQTVVIGNQTWFQRNLNYAVEGSKCYGEGSKVYNSNTGQYDITLSDLEIQANCDTYGRLYDWATAMALPSTCNKELCTSQIDTKYQGICPDGWHIPSNADWNVLMKFINPSCSDNGNCYGAGTKLKSANLWEWYYGVPAGTDNYNFSALPGGSSDGNFRDVGNHGYWWSSELGNDNAYYRNMSLYDKDVKCGLGDKSWFYSVRCVKD